MYDIHQFREDLVNAMQSRPNTGGLSGRALGNTSNIAKWSPGDVERFFLGLRTAYGAFFSSEKINFRTYCRVIICECMQESTGDRTLGFNTGGGFKPVVNIDTDHRSYGLIQVTPASVVRDFHHFGQPIICADRKELLVPGEARTLDLTDPFVNIVIHAWYTKNSVSCRMSLREHVFRDVWHIVPRKNIAPDLGNCMFTWLAGPHNDRQDPKQAPAFADYYNRVCDYFVASGFGSRADFDRALAADFVNTSTKKTWGVYDDAVNTYGEKEFMKVHMNDRDTVFGL